MYKAWNNSVSKVLSTNTCFCWCTICPRSNAIGLSLDSYLKKPVKWYDTIVRSPVWENMVIVQWSIPLIDWWCKYWGLYSGGHCYKLRFFESFKFLVESRILFDGSTCWINCRQRAHMIGKDMISHFRNIEYVIKVVQQCTAYILVILSIYVICYH